jgi:5-methylcytosine-specific restriction endonuclease McrA
MRRAAARATGSAANGSILERLWDEQGGRCALSGLPLVIGEYASVDHKIPLSKGGTHDASNLRWLAFEVNMAKNNMSDEEFVAMCRRVVALADPAK